MKTHITYKIAHAAKDFEDGEKLFQEYAKSLSIDLSFQDFASELKTIEKQYNKPRGALMLAYNEELAVGCAGIRELDNEIAELKRMFVQQEYRGCQIGQTLLNMAIDTAIEIGYKKIRLDTLPDMTKAQNLYKEMGFYTIPAYRLNPIKETVYMEKNLCE